MVISTDFLTSNNVTNVSTNQDTLRKGLLLSQTKAQDVARDSYIPTLVSADAAIPTGNYNAEGLMEDEFGPVSGAVTDNNTGMDSAYMNVMTGDSQRRNLSRSEGKDTGDVSFEVPFAEEIRNELNIL